MDTEKNKRRAETIEGSLVETLKKSDLSTIGTGLVDGLFDDDLMADSPIPILSTLAKIKKMGSSISNYLFMKKVAYFLLELKDIPPRERREQIEKMTSDEEHANDVGEKVLLLLDRMNDMQKPAMMGRTFKAYLSGHIAMADLERLNYAIDTIRMAAIPLLVGMYKSGIDVIGGEDAEHLMLCGLVSTALGDEKVNEKKGINGLTVVKSSQRIRIMYRRNPLGDKFCEYAIGDEDNVA